jgi:hypothetical protein
VKADERDDGTIERGGEWNVSAHVGKTRFGNGVLAVAGVAVPEDLTELGDG